ncbi:phage terminase large subunit [Pseudooceanicola spongiae]|uniref:Phage terminase large subunit n=1 Tax=Pseudooceanicola spongiae TaxID=2613965 RepID=A0A7L9WMY0_9RHOB|nr:phage terminase large subunit [Pseudooceanicola spongiae]QOL80420.1 phage terminase large subunit [Pseudooceanicola spongiae]
MTRRPKLRASISKKDFRDKIADMANDFARHIELNVEAFASDPVAKAERLRRVAEEDGFQFFMETYLPHYVRGEHSLFHQHIFARVPEILASEKGVRDLFIAPRGASKSTHLSLGFALYCIVRGLKRYIIEVCDVYEQAALLIEAIKAELTTNIRLQNDFPEAFGAGRLWREGEIITQNNVRVEGLGAAKKIRGRRHGPYRPDLLFLDDIENDDAVRSPDQRKKLWNWIYRAALKVGPPDGSMDVVWVGTVLHFDAVIVRAAKSPGWNVTEFQAVVQFPDRMDMWEAFEEVYHNDGEEAARAFYAQHQAEMDLGAIVNWPGVQSLLFLMLERAADLAAFQTEYQNKPISEGNPFGDLKYWVQRRHDWVFFGAIDPSLGKKGKGRDPSAILIGGFDRLSGTMDLVEASIRKRLPDLIIADTIALQKEYGALLWFVESVQFQEFLRTQLMVEAAKQGIGISAIPVTPSADKDLRIERLQPPVAAGLIRFNATHTTLIDQLQQWPNADHDDGPDALDMLWQNTLLYAGGAAGGQMLTASAPAGGDGLGGYRLGGRG